MAWLDIDGEILDLVSEHDYSFLSYEWVSELGSALDNIDWYLCDG